MLTDTVTILVKPHPGQLAVHQDPARFKVLAAGRRWGKTRLGVNECLDVASQGGRAWWVSPNYKMSEVGWRPIRNIAGRLPGVEIKLADRLVIFPGGGLVSVRSADAPDSLRGEGLDFIVLDEAAYIQREAWQEALRPALSDRLGRALFISTPRGRNWFWEVYMRGEREEPGWNSWRFPTSANPYISQEEIDAARADLPELIYRQEFEAEFIDDNGGVFRRVQEAAVLEPLEAPIAGRQYIAGVDVAASVDYTVVSIMDVESREMVYMDRFNRVDYGVLINRLESLYNRWKLSIIKIESNSIGQPVIDALQKRGLNIIPFLTTSGTKQVLIQNLQAAFENEQIKILNNRILIGELLSFESKRSASGSFSYSAPEGEHDDCVMSLALAWDVIRPGRNVILFGA